MKLARRHRALHFCVDKVRRDMWEGRLTGCCCSLRYMRTHASGRREMRSSLKVMTEMFFFFLASHLIEIWQKAPAIYPSQTDLRCKSRSIAMCANNRICRRPLTWPFLSPRSALRVTEDGCHSQLWWFMQCRSLSQLDLRGGRDIRLERICRHSMSERKKCFGTSELYTCLTVFD